MKAEQFGEHLRRRIDESDRKLQINLDLVKVTVEAPRAHAVRVVDETVTHLQELAGTLAGVQLKKLAEGKTGEARYTNGQIERVISALQDAQALAAKLAEPKQVMRTRSLGETNED